MLRKTKTTLIFAVLFVSIFVAPGLSTVKAQSSALQGWNFSFDSSNPDNVANMPQSMANGLGSIFGMFAQLGPSGAALGQVFTLLFQNIMNFSVTDSLVKGVYTLNATYQNSTIIPEQDFNNNTDSPIYFLDNNIYKDASWNSTQAGYAYFVRNGTTAFNYTYGAAIVFIIWDHDGSLITALQKVVTAFQNVKHELESNGDPNSWTQSQSQEVYNTVINEVLNAVTYFLIHINDIITGDELIVTNLITWDSYNLVTSPDYHVALTFKVAGNYYSANPETDQNITNDTLIQNWENTAIQNNDTYTIWLTTQYFMIKNQTTMTTHWTRFSFNLIELWLKNFQIHINVSAIVNLLTNSVNSQGSSQNLNLGIAQVFQGLDINVYLITHSLLGFVAYNHTTNKNGVPEVNYNNGHFNSNVKDYFVLGNPGNFVFKEPTKTSDGTGIKWSIRMNNVQMLAVPLGKSPTDIVPVYQNLTYIEMGFTFTPKLNDLVNTTGYVNSTQAETVKMGSGIIKLNQYFGQWNDGNGPSGSSLNGLGFSVLFMSTIIHLHINFEVQKLPNPNDTSAMYSQQGLLKNSSYYQGEGVIKVGTYTGDLPVAAIDIAGPEYVQTSGTTTKTNTTYPAKTCTIPLAFIDFNAKANKVNVNTENPNQSFNATGILNLTASAMLYAVSYPTWNGTGDGISHDPTFSVFMTWNSPGFWALILVIGGVTLVGVAAILITKRKNRV